MLYWLVTHMLVGKRSVAVSQPSKGKLFPSPINDLAEILLISLTVSCLLHIQSRCYIYQPFFYFLITDSDPQWQKEIDYLKLMVQLITESLERSLTLEIWERIGEEIKYSVLNKVQWAIASVVLKVIELAILILNWSRDSPSYKMLTRV